MALSLTFFISSKRSINADATSHIYNRPKENTVASSLLRVDAAGIKGVQINIGVFDGVRIEYEAAIDRPSGDQEIAGDRDRE